MIDAVLAWTMVAFGGLTFAGFLFGVAAGMTILERAVRTAKLQPQPARVKRPITSARRLWA